MGWPEVQRRYPWPDSQPTGLPHVHGWGVHEEAWQGMLGGLRTPIVLEVGAWTGKTSRWLLDTFPGLQLIAIDQWEADGYWGETWSKWLAAGLVAPGETPLGLYRTNLWQYRQRVVAIQGDSCRRMLAIADAVAPRVVYIDACHQCPQVCSDIGLASVLFPAAIICGDDYEDLVPPVNAVKAAVDGVAARYGFEVKLSGRFWQYV